MNSRTPPEHAPEVTATKVSTGVSPRLIALGLAVVLVAVVYIGVTGKGLDRRQPRLPLIS